MVPPLRLPSGHEEEVRVRCHGWADLPAEAEPRVWEVGVEAGVYPARCTGFLPGSCDSGHCPDTALSLCSRSFGH